MPEKHYSGSKWIKKVAYAAFVIFSLKMANKGSYVKDAIPGSTENVRKWQSNITINWRIPTSSGSAILAEPSQLTATNWPRSNDFVTWFRQWFRHSDFVTKWGFGQDGSGNSKHTFRIALLSQSGLFAVSWFAVSLSRSVVMDPYLQCYHKHYSSFRFMKCCNTWAKTQMEKYDLH